MEDPNPNFRAIVVGELCTFVTRLVGAEDLRSLWVVDHVGARVDLPVWLGRVGVPYRIASTLVKWEFFVGAQRLAILCFTIIARSHLLVGRSHRTFGRAAIDRLGDVG